MHTTNNTKNTYLHVYVFVCARARRSAVVAGTFINIESENGGGGDQLSASGSRGHVGLAGGADPARKYLVDRYACFP